MSATARLGRRVSTVEQRSGHAHARLRIDLDRLTGVKADRLRVLVSRSLAGITTDAEASELKCLLYACLTLSEPTKVRNRFCVPKSLERYWRMQKYADTGYELPGGNYRFNGLWYADREQLLNLCRAYGWEPNDPEVCMSPLEGWARGDLEKLAEVLWWATPEMERAMWGYGGVGSELSGAEA